MKATYLRVRGIDRVSDVFLRVLARLCERVDVQPDYLMAVMSNETGGTFDPAIHPPNGHAVGLIQFLPSTARALGTTTEELAAMGQVAQLRYVERFFEAHARRGLARKRPVDTYLAVFTGGEHIGEAESSVIYSAPSKNYTANDGFDRDKPKKGYITVGDVAAVINAQLASAAKRGTREVEVWPEGAGWGLVLGAAVVAVGLGVATGARPA